MNISIFASIGAQNLGDELIVKNEIRAIELGKIFPLSLAKTFQKKSQKSLFYFRVFTYDTSHCFTKAENISYRGYFPIGIKSPKNFFKNIVNFYSFFSSILWSDFILIGGGGLFYDSEFQASRNNLQLWKGRTSIFTFFKKKVIFYGVSIDIKDEGNKDIVGKIFANAFKIFVRDEASKLFLQEQGITSKEIWDPVFYDKEEEFLKKSLAIKTIVSKDFNISDLEGIDFQGKKVGLALRQGYLGKGENEISFLKEVISHLLKSGAKQVVLLPMSFHPLDFQANDYYFLQELISDNVVMGGENVEEVYENFTTKNIDICITMRLHSIILSQVYGIPYIALSYSKKTDEILKKLST